VESSEQQGRLPPAPSAQRLLVMWVCWVLLATFLIVAGVCTFA
jgi:hypothetical protein